MYAFADRTDVTPFLRWRSFGACAVKKETCLQTVLPPLTDSAVGVGSFEHLILVRLPDDVHARTATSLFSSRRRNVSATEGYSSSITNCCTNCSHSPVECWWRGAARRSLHAHLYYVSYALHMYQ